MYCLNESAFMYFICSKSVCAWAFYVNDMKLNAQNSKLNKFMHTKYTSNILLKLYKALQKTAPMNGILIEFEFQHFLSFEPDWCGCMPANNELYHFRWNTSEIKSPQNHMKCCRMKRISSTAENIVECFILNDIKERTNFYSETDDSWCWLATLTFDSITMNALKLSDQRLRWWRICDFYISFRIRHSNMRTQRLMKHIALMACVWLVA